MAKRSIPSTRRALAQVERAMREPDAIHVAPTPVAELIARIEAALASRQACGTTDRLVSGSKLFSGHSGAKA